MEILDRLYQEYKEITQDDDISKLEYISIAIFDFTTYDSEIGEMFALKMIEVLNAIIDHATFDYFEDNKEKYINYLTMVNMHFLYDKLEYGTSIRGAWLDESKIYLFDCDKIKVEKGELGEFIKGLIEWSKDKK